MSETQAKYPLEEDPGDEALDEAQICRDVEHMTLVAVGKKWGISPRKIRGILKKHCIVLVPRQSSMERAWQTAWTQVRDDPWLLNLHMPSYVEQYRFDETRKWRFDVAWPEYRVAVELHGGTYSGGRHVTGSGIAKDAEKGNAAIEAGWAVLVFTTDMLEKDPHGCVTQVLRVLAARR